MANHNSEMSCVEEDLDEKRFSSDEEGEYVDDPESLEIAEAFNTYSVDYDTLIGSQLKIPLEDCRPALIQILNRFVSAEEIAQALNDGSASSLNLEKFRQLYFIIKNPENATDSAQLSFGSENDELRRATITNSVPLLVTSLSLKSMALKSESEDNQSEKKSAAGSALQAARLSKTSAQ